MTAEFASRMGWCGRFALAGLSFIIALAGAAYAGDTPDPSGPSIQSAFESTVVKLSAKPDSQALPVEWAYTNHFDYPLLVRYDQSCGCLSGQVAPSGHEAVPPGKTGTIRATFTPGNHRGVLKKSLHVRFVGHERPVELVVEVTIPSSVELSAREVVWNADEKPAPRVIEVTSGNGTDFTITGLVGAPENQFTLSRNHHLRQTLPPAYHSLVHRHRPALSASPHG